MHTFQKVIHLKLKPFKHTWKNDLSLCLAQISSTFYVGFMFVFYSLSRYCAYTKSSFVIQRGTFI